ncbi:putative metabolite transport protein YwtG [Musca domestica]|uniref:Metabolite transport protein YwtG n=1 Tax=Musca domestica TaxID=7370 RepID=A0A9J7I2T3_MUSDO|nr:putative metabolite transport protein YwtG [Musca domestica]
MGSMTTETAATATEKDNCNNNHNNNNNNCNKSSSDTMPDRPADFETAIKACGFGRFNILLLVAALPAVMATVLETAVVSYILPSAECDLSLDLLDKGILNAITYCGMITSAIGWGYLADNKGRRNLLIIGFFLDVICVICGALSQSRTQLMIAKFCGGFVMCGPFAVLMTYLSEFHGNNFRSRIMMIIGVMFSMAAIMLPVLAIVVLPLNWNFDIFNMNFVAWKMYLAICGIPSLLSCILFCFFPESPRFLITQGRNSEALEAFKTMYALNTGKSKDTYPIKKLIKEIKQKEDSSDKISVATIEANMKDICKEEKQEADNNSVKDDTLMDKQPNTFKVLCSKQYVGLCFRVCLMQFFILLGQNTMRLWLPQMFASLNEYEQISNESTSMCTILEYSVNKTELVKNPSDECIVIITPSSYTNNIIVACIGFVTYLVAGSLINALGNKRIQVIGLMAAGSCGIALYWSSSSLTTLIITSMYSALGSMSATSSIGTSVNLFPTSLRTMIVSLTMMIGRMGSILGNVLFPIFMSFGCIPPFVMVGVVMYLGCLLAAFLPSTNKVELK